MSYYYKASEEFSKEFFELLEKINNYQEVVFQWHELHFDVDKENDEIYIFNDIPMFTHSFTRKNIFLRELQNKSNERLSQRNTKAKELIKDWQNFKGNRGYKKMESYTRSDYAWMLRRYFFMGSISTVTDKKNNELYLKTSYENEGSNNEFIQITLREFNEKEIEMSEKS